MSEEYTKVFTSFGGADAVVSFNGKVIGELQEVKWNKNLSKFASPTIDGTIKAAVFDRDPLVEYEGKTFNILTQYMNEYGQKRLEFIWQAHLETKAGGMSIDQIVTEVEYTFKANDVTDVPWLDTHQEMMEYMLENLDSPYLPKKMIARAYADLLSFGMSIGRFKLMEQGEYRRLYDTERQFKSEKFDAAKFAQQILQELSDKGI